MEIQSGRDEALTLDNNGFCLLPHAWSPHSFHQFFQEMGGHLGGVSIRSKVWKHIDYYDHKQVIDTYYAECEAESMNHGFVL